MQNRTIVRVRLRGALHSRQWVYPGILEKFSGNWGRLGKIPRQLCGNVGGNLLKQVTGICEEILGRHIMKES